MRAPDRIASLFPLLAAAVCAFSLGQQIPQKFSDRFYSDRSVLVFTERPESLSLLPSFPGEVFFRDRHAALRAHFTQEGLFTLSGAGCAVDRRAIDRIVASVPSLADLSYPDEETGKDERLFKFARVLDDPIIKDGELSFILETADVDFGTSRYRVSLVDWGAFVELHLENMDSLKFHFFPAVRPGKALVDLIYFPRPVDPIVYIAWSVRATFGVPGFIEIERPLRHRALAIKDWYVRQLESVER